MPYIYSKDVTYGSTDTGGRPGRPNDGGLIVFKGQGNITSYKITKAALKQLSEHYNANTTKDLLNALHLEHEKGSGNMLSELEVEGAYERTEITGEKPFDKSKEGVLVLKIIELVQGIKKV